MKAFLFVLIFLSTNVFAWGPIGHRIVGKIAEDNLKPNIKNKIAEILVGKDLAYVSVWADLIRSDANWDFAKPWHFSDVSDGEVYKPGKPEGDIVSASTEMISTLKNSKRSLEERQNALKFLVHFIGDIHQPLHTGRPEDKGGNTIKVIFMSRSLNLHSLWDSGMIDHQQIGYEDYARRLQNSFLEDYDLEEIQFSKIMAENFKYRKKIYNFPVNNAGVGLIDEKYFNEHKQFMDSRLLIAGKRLANILNKVLAD